MSATSRGNPELPITVAPHGDAASIVACIILRRNGLGAQWAGAPSSLPHEGMRHAAIAFSVERIFPACADIIERVA
jgi:hypothetical protein